MNVIQIDLPDCVKNDIERIKFKLGELQKNLQPKDPPEYLTRTEVSEMLKIDISTVHNWTKRGILKAHSIGSRIYYKRSQVESAIVEL
ncbi:hypothetical protein JoomaDRAFT_0746 [Galbibacter orientalis DSM 19592]|uniref:Helix-turn-helix domain-containing protein n=1 Tax=Galbibacter orientalis DSM 19592 TaxID=926559 RepID=I3C2D7_9FLAO|nr:helix-turn-helix domain-containing protein [Galbibacter orientalis]EIJ37780.1 hypothetical protein JoomaDRAFT_0746 [Galbibacter orientalis DSM 19592]